MGKSNAAVTVYFNRAESWLNILTCNVDSDSIVPHTVEVLPFSEATLERWMAASCEGSNVYVFEATRRE